LSEESASYKTCLIFGAGISHAYGYPLGIGLIDKIKAKLEFEGNQPSRTALSDLNSMQPYSIDSFLSMKPQYDVIIKAIIAEILFESEEIRKFDKPSEPDHFYRYFFNAIQDQDLTKFSIISFNYDRSLEFYLARAFNSKNGGGRSKSYDHIKNLRIVHIHGRLPELPEGEGLYKNSRSRDIIGYGDYVPKLVNAPSSDQDVNIEFKVNEYISQRQREIWDYGRSAFKTVYENNNKNENAIEYLKEANRILFLGFGFHALNMKILGFENDSSYLDKTIAGTCLKMPTIEQRKLRSNFVQFARNNIFDVSAVDFFRDHCSLLDPNLDTFNRK
jgi:hypothetical protein